MVVKKSHLISMALVLAFAGVSFADGDNNLVQLDLKRSSDNSVDVTMFTSNNYNDNVLVRKKSDNKYVILIPKVQSSGYSASNLAGVRDLVSNIDVKTVNDTSGGYTKVTLITTKPLDIKTRTTKTKPLTAEQKEYNTLIAQANAVKNNISNRQDPPKIREQKTEVTVNKAPAITETSKSKTEVKSDVKNETKTQTKSEVKPEPKKQEVKLVEVDNEKIAKQVRKERLTDLINEVKQEKALEEIPKNAPETTPVVSEEINDIENMPKTSLFAGFGHNIKSMLSKAVHKIPSKLPKTLGLILITATVITLLSKLFKKSDNFAYDIPEYVAPEEKAVSEPKDYDDIVNDNGLSWKEKYKLYLDKSATPVARANKKGNYSFIKTPSKDAIEAKRQELEKLVSETSYKPEINNIESEITEVHSEDNSIRRTIKLKAFDNSVPSLKMTHRERSRFRKYEVEVPFKEQKTVKLDDSPLGMNPRNLKGANLKVSDVDSRRITYEPKDYIMSSVDEYLSILDNEQKISMPQAPVKPVVSNPIDREKQNPFKGTIVKSGFKISPDKGIYLINKNGKNALVGKINDKVFVLKKFEGNITNPIQVRRDKDDVYMVKAGGFKSLVEVSDDKMGVLIEL